MGRSGAPIRVLRRGGWGMLLGWILGQTDGAVDGVATGLNHRHGPRAEPCSRQADRQSAPVGKPSQHCRRRWSATMSMSYRQGWTESASDLLEQLGRPESNVEDDRPSISAAQAEVPSCSIASCGSCLMTALPPAARARARACLTRTRRLSSEFRIGLLDTQGHLSRNARTIATVAFGFSSMTQ
jgi:hypothetical protein